MVLERSDQDALSRPRHRPVSRTGLRPPHPANFALLAGLDPAGVHRWYLGVYVDAFEWVELPNTLGMSQFADGGLLATKP